MFSGSYLPSDVHFLLTPLARAPLFEVAEKEARLQAGIHYSEMLSPERAPAPAYLRLFETQLQVQKYRLALGILSLANHLRSRANAASPVALVSLARAGTPVGVLLKRTLESPRFGLPIKHYSVSILRDRGLDMNALGYIRARHEDENIFFIDGWTGKGIIGEELTRSVCAFNAAHSARIRADLHVLADIAGSASVCATREDYLLPSALLNAPVSGLISRTVLPPEHGRWDFHGCLVLADLAPYDQSRHFVDTVQREIERIDPASAPAVLHSAPNRALQEMVTALMARFELSHRNFVKPGVGEATRVLLRRVPKQLLLRDPTDPAVQHLLQLCQEKNFSQVIEPSLPCRAVALIEQAD